MLNSNRYDYLVCIGCPGELNEFDFYEFMRLNFLSDLARHMCKIRKAGVSRFDTILVLKAEYRGVGGGALISRFMLHKGGCDISKILETVWGQK